MSSFDMVKTAPLRQEAALRCVRTQAAGHPRPEGALVIAREMQVQRWGRRVQARPVRSHRNAKTFRKTVTQPAPYLRTDHQ